MAAIAAQGKNSLIRRPLTGPLPIALPLPRAPGNVPPLLAAGAPGNFPPPLAAGAPGNFPPPLAGEGRVGASRSTHVIANRQPANTIVLNRSPTGSSSARRRAAPRIKPVTRAARRGAASRTWITAEAG